MNSEIQELLFLIHELFWHSIAWQYLTWKPLKALGQNHQCFCGISLTTNVTLRTMIRQVVTGQRRWF